MSDTERKIPGHPNLRVPTSEEAREMGRLGGKRSAEVRRKRKTMAEALDEYLSAQLQPSHPRYAEIKRMLRVMGLIGDGEEPDNQMLILAGQMQRAQKDPTAAAFIRDTVGEKPKDTIEASIDAPPPIVIGLHDAAWVEKERKRNERMVAEMRRTAVEVPAKEVGTETVEDRTEAAVEGADARGAEEAQQGAEDAPAQQGAATPPSGVERAEPPKPTPPAPVEPPKPEPPPKPPKPVRPVDPNVCLPSATPPV